MDNTSQNNNELQGQAAEVRAAAFRFETTSGPVPEILGAVWCSTSRVMYEVDDCLTLTLRLPSGDLIRFRLHKDQAESISVTLAHSLEVNEGQILRWAHPAIEDGTPSISVVNPPGSDPKLGLDNSSTACSGVS